MRLFITISCNRDEPLIIYSTDLGHRLHTKLQYDNYKSSRSKDGKRLHTISSIGTCSCGCVANREEQKKEGMIEAYLIFNVCLTD